MSMSEIRSRHHAPTSSFNARPSGPSMSSNVDDDDNNVKTKQSDQWIGLHHWSLFVITNFCLILYIQHSNYVVPTPLKSDTAPPDRFIEERARVHLDALVSLGPRPTGSYENEVLAVKYLVQEIEAVQRLVHPVHRVEQDVQTVSGSFSLINGRVMSVYQNMHNVVVKMSPKTPNITGSDVKTSGSVLINCHYDSVIGGPGASDDAVSCSTMLEVLRVIAVGPKPLRNSIIFLFNGAEEIGLQASHGFITKHKWAADVKAFINLEAAGAGGKELLFQTGPEYPWLIRTYVDHAPHPFATIIAQEVFGTGLIPSDTDFRIFRDFGHVPGLDIGYITNGYIYHTPSDLPHMIPSGCMQHAGDNLLAVARAVADSPYLTDPGQYRHGKLFYFDFFGFFMIAYTVRVSWIINFVCLAAVAFWFVDPNLKVI